MSSIEGTFRIARVRYQDPRSHAAILVADQLDSGGSSVGRRVLRIPGHLAISRFHVAQTLRATGSERAWHNQRSGEREIQISVAEWEEIRPRGAAWVDMVAHNPAFAGVGRRFATKVWDALGDDTIKHLEAGDADAILDAVPELGIVRVTSMIEAWRECGHEDLIRWLNERCIPRQAANRLLAAYRHQSGVIEMIDRDPYRLMAFGVAFKPADEIARKSFKIEKSDPRRLHAAVVQCLNRAYIHGHTAVNEPDLLEMLASLTGLDRPDSDQAIKSLYNDGGFVRPFPGTYQLRGAYLMEREIAEDLARRAAQGAQHKLVFDRLGALASFEGSQTKLLLSAAQRSAVLSAANDSISLILGGAGTGKTACLRALHSIVEAEVGRSDTIIQMTVAGKAAKRIKEATGREAVTVAGFLHVVDDERIAMATHTVIDEASMVDVPSFYRVLRRLKGRTQLVLVGDPFQLPPIGAGKVLHVLADRHEFTATTLEAVFRQGHGSPIRGVASAVRLGSKMTLKPFVDDADGVFLLEADADPAGGVMDVLTTLRKVAVAGDLCTIAATRQGKRTSALELNRNIQALLNSGETPIYGSDGDTGFAVGDRFVCDVNFWDLDLMNGSLGVIGRALRSEEVAAIEAHLEGDNRAAGWGRPLVEVEIDGGQKVLHELHLKHCSWGYALTCHRAQGSDFDTVIVSLDGKIDRSWLYTATTRGRRQVVLVGTKEQLDRAIATPPRVDDRTIALPLHLNRVGNIQNEQHAAA